MDFILSAKNVSGIPILELHNPKSTNASPLIIVIHGFGSKKEDMLLYGLELAKEGYYTCLIDAYNHGEISFKKLDIMTLTLKDMLNIFDETANNINKLIDSYKYNELIDIEQIGLFGISMGGTIIFKYLADNNKENIKVAVPIITSPVWSNVLQWARDKFENAGPINPEELKFIKEIDKTNLLKKMKKIPILMLNGENDEIVPIEKVMIDYNLLKDHYINKDEIKLIKYPGIGHQVNAEMVKESKLWFKRFFYK